jgi:hypothetical protein
MYEIQTHAASHLVYCSETGRSTLQDVHRCELHHQLFGEASDGIPLRNIASGRLPSMLKWQPRSSGNHPFNRCLQVLVMLGMGKE